MVTRLTRMYVCVPSTVTRVPCEWCPQSCSMVALHVCPVSPQKTGPDAGLQAGAELSIPPQPKPYRPVIA